MSRIGKAPIEIPAGVTVTVNNDLVTVKGPKGELSQKVNSDLTVKVENGHVIVERPTDDREHRAQQGRAVPATDPQHGSRRFDRLPQGDGACRCRLQSHFRRSGA